MVITHMRSEDQKTFCGRRIVERWTPEQMTIPNFYVLNVPRQGKKWSSRRYVNCRICVKHQYDPIIEKRKEEMCRVCFQYDRHEGGIVHTKEQMYQEAVRNGWIEERENKE